MKGVKYTNDIADKSFWLLPEYSLNKSLGH